MGRSGFLLQEVALYSEPSSSAPVMYKSTGQVAISKRANNMAYCALPGGADGWVEETDISYTFPADYNMGY
jgi:SH3-like domain-containing protein